MIQKNMKSRFTFDRNRVTFSSTVRENITCTLRFIIFLFLNLAQEFIFSSGDHNFDPSLSLLVVIVSTNTDNTFKVYL